MDIYRPGDTLLVSDVAREAKRVAHPCPKYRVSQRYEFNYPIGG